MSTRGKVFFAPSVGGPLGAPEPDADIAAGRGRAKKDGGEIGQENDRQDSKKKRHNQS